MEVDDAKVFKILDLEDIEKTFSAYQRQQVLRTEQLILAPALQMWPSIVREARVGGRRPAGPAGLHFIYLFLKFLLFCNFWFLKHNKTKVGMKQKNKIENLMKSGEMYRYIWEFIRCKTFGSQSVTPMSIMTCKHTHNVSNLICYKHTYTWTDYKAFYNDL